MRKLGIMDAEPAEHIAAVLGQCLVMSDEVVANATRLTQLVKWSPVTVEGLTGTTVDDELNKLPKRHRVGLAQMPAIPAFDVRRDSTKIPAVSAEHNEHFYSAVTEGRHSHTENNATEMKILKK